MTRRNITTDLGDVEGPMGIEQLETALRQIERGEIDPDAYWDAHIECFRQTVLLAIRETADAILAASMPNDLRVELEAQLAMLGRCVQLAEQYRKLRSLSRGQPAPPLPLTSRSIH